MPQNKPDQKQIDRAWQYYQDADNRHTGRINFFLVAESILLVSFVATFLIETKCWGILTIQTIQFSIILMGLVFTFSWFVVNTRIARRMKLLRIEYLQHDPVYKRYIDGVSPRASNAFLTYFLPVSTFLFWLFWGILLVSITRIYEYVCS